MFVRGLLLRGWFEIVGRKMGYWFWDTLWWYVWRGMKSAWIVVIFVVEKGVLKFVIDRKFVYGKGGYQIFILIACQCML